jgi:hypothetical protein
LKEANWKPETAKVKKLLIQQGLTPNDTKL